MALAIEICGLPDIIRGYEHIKLDNVEKYHARLAELLTVFTTDQTHRPHTVDNMPVERPE